MGSYTTGNVFYKPAYGASGTSEKAAYDSAMDTAAALILAASATASAGNALAAVATSNAAVALTTATGAIAKSIGTTKGNIIVYTGSATPVVLAPSTTNGQILMISTAAAGNVAWSDSALLSYSATIAASGVVTASGDYTCPHSLGNQFVLIVLADNANTAVTPDSVVYTNANTCVINMTAELSGGTLPGAYNVFVVG